MIYWSHNGCGVPLFVCWCLSFFKHLREVILQTNTKAKVYEVIVNLNKA